MSKFITCFLLAISLCSLARAADGPTPYPDPKDEKSWPGQGPIRLHGWMPDNRKFFWKNRDADQNKIVFVGDSLTANWKGLLKSEFPNWNVTNRGIGGDVSRGLLFRFKEDVVDLKPAAIVLCIGTNDLSAHANVDHIESNIKTILEQARSAKPNLPIILCNVPPRDQKDAPTKPGAHKDLNTRLAKIAETGKHITLVDSYSALSKDGKIVEEYFAKDRLHIAEPGYKRWAEVIRPALEKLNLAK